MRVRENRGLQLALILFTAVTVVLGISTYTYFHKLQMEKAERRALADQIRQLKSQATKSDEDATKLRTMIGPYRHNIPVEEIAYDHAIDVYEVFPGHEPWEKPPYRQLVSHLARTIRTAAAREVEALRREEAREEEIQHRHAEHLREVEILHRSQTELGRDLKREQRRLTELRQAYVQRCNKLADQLDKKADQIVQWEMKYDQERKSLERALAKVQKRYEMMRRRWEESLPDTDFQRPDGRITTVDGRSRTVLIDLGSDDLLLRGLSFSVFEGPVDNVARAKRKGSIEVIRILDSQSAEARITDDALSDPILPADVVFTPVWQPGQQRHFALAGWIDIDGDGKSDRQKVRDLITSSGGLIDAEVDESGKRTGKITIETRYLVVGRPPEPPTGGEEELRAMGRIINEANQFGVDQMSVRKFLDLMGYQPSAEVVQLGRTGRDER